MRARHAISYFFAIDAIILLPLMPPLFADAAMPLMPYTRGADAFDDDFRRRFSLPPLLSFSPFRSFTHATCHTPLLMSYATIAYDAVFIFEATLRAMLMLPILLPRQLPRAAMPLALLMPLAAMLPDARHTLPLRRFFFAATRCRHMSLLIRLNK